MLVFDRKRITQQLLSVGLSVCMAQSWPVSEFLETAKLSSGCVQSAPDRHTILILGQKHDDKILTKSPFWFAVFGYILKRCKNK